MGGVFDRILAYQDDRDYVSGVNAAVLYGAHRNSRVILGLSLLFVLIALVWAYNAKLDEVTRGRGKIIPASHIQIVQNLEGGILSEILVQEGELVEKGQSLMRLDDLRFASSYKESRLKYFELMIKVTRLSAEVKGELFTVPKEVADEHPDLAESEHSLFQSRKSELQNNISIFNEKVRQQEQELIALNAKKNQQGKSYRLLKQEVEMSAPLVKEGALSEVELLRLRRSLNDLKGDLNATRLTVPKVQSALEEARNKIEELKLRFRREAVAELNEAKAELARLSETILAHKDRVSRTLVTSPVKGTVNQLKVTTIGGVIQPGMDLLEIVPIEDQLLIETQIRPADIAFLHPGQEAMVKLTAYDFSIYGGLRGKLEHISADTIVDENDESYYLIRIRTDKNYLGNEQEPLHIISGMTADVDILTGKKTVLDYLMKPVLKAKQLALRER